MVPAGLQIGKSNENLSVFIDFQRIQVGPGGMPGFREEGEMMVKRHMPGVGRNTKYNLSD